MSQKRFPKQHPKHLTASSFQSHTCLRGRLVDQLIQQLRSEGTVI